LTVAVLETKPKGSGFRRSPSIGAYGWAGFAGAGVGALSGEACTGGAPLTFENSNALTPFGPIVINIGLPSLVLAWTRNASCRTFTSENPAFCRSCVIFSIVGGDRWSACCGLAAAAAARSRGALTPMLPRTVSSIGSARRCLGTARYLQQSHRPYGFPLPKIAFYFSDPVIRKEVCRQGMRQAHNDDSLRTALRMTGTARPQPSATNFIGQFQDGLCVGCIGQRVHAARRTIAHREPQRSIGIKIHGRVVGLVQELSRGTSLITAQNAPTLSGARARPAPGRAIALASRAAAQGTARW
jgi:hypothetical protein